MCVCVCVYNYGDAPYFSSPSIYLLPVVSWSLNQALRKQVIQSAPYCLLGVHGLTERGRTQTGILNYENSGETPISSLVGSENFLK